ncbi:hypothetical protein PVAP13_2NG097884 [Panicum virgatum]|uniref:Uncharacterized protein n=1 Tax=Panicum virgatum TaxID=38727 RepID=A0A8T0VCB4_PANVG|nr:hypothetical protein PVAP13_2NG097884 [Panicum virgatum]
MLMGLQWLRSLPSSSPSDDGIHTSSSRLIHIDVFLDSWSTSNNITDQVQFLSGCITPKEL